MRSLIPIVFALTTLTPLAAHSASCGPFTGYQCPPMAVGSPQDAQEDRERVERAEAALEEFRAARRSYEAERAEAERGETVREMRRLRRSVEDANDAAATQARRARSDDAWNAYVAGETAHREADRRRGPRNVTITDTVTGRTFYGVID